MKRQKTMILRSNIKINKGQEWKAIEEAAVTMSANEEIRKKWTKTKKRQELLRIILAEIFIIVYLVHCLFSNNSSWIGIGLPAITLVGIYYLVLYVFNKPVNKYAWFQNFIQELQQNATNLFHERKKAIYEQALIEIFGEVEDTSFGKLDKSYGFLFVTSKAEPVIALEHRFASLYTFKCREFPSCQDVCSIQGFLYNWQLNFERCFYWKDKTGRILHIYIKSCFLNAENVCVALEGEKLSWNFTSSHVNHVDGASLQTDNYYGCYNFRDINDRDSLIKSLHDDSGWPD